MSCVGYLILSTLAFTHLEELSPCLRLMEAAPVKPPKISGSECWCLDFYENALSSQSYTSTESCKNKMLANQNWDVEVSAGVNGKSLCYSKDDIQISSLWLSSCADRKQHCRKTTAALFISVGISTQGRMPNKWNYYLWQKVISGSLYTHVCLKVSWWTDWWLALKPCL